MDWHPAAGELDDRSWVDVDLTASPDNPDISPWVISVPGPIDQVRLAPPHYDGTPAYAYAVDYDATIDDCDPYATVHAWFQPGIYTAEISFRDGRPAQLFTLFAGSKYNGPRSSPLDPPPTGGSLMTAGVAVGAGDGDKKDPNCLKFAEYAKIPWDQLSYDPGAFIIEDPESDNGYIKRGAEVMGDKAVRAGDVATAANKIVDAYKAKGSPVNLVMVGHGANTSLAVGAGQGDTEGKYLFMKGTKSNNDFIAKVSAGGTQRVQRLAMIGCCVSGRVRELVDDHLMCDMARGLAPGTSVTEVLAFAVVTNNVLASESRDRKGYFTVAGSNWANHGTLLKKAHCDSWKQARVPPR